MTRNAGRPEHPPFGLEDNSGPLVWGAFQRAGVWITRGSGEPRFRFAAGSQAEVKGDAARLNRHPVEHGLMVGLMAVHPCVQWADVLVGVPDGMNDMADEVAGRTGKDLVRMYRATVGGDTRFDFRFDSGRDKKLVEAARTACILEDLSSTGSSAFVVATQLRDVQPGLRTHSLSEMQRGPVLPEYDRDFHGVEYHTLCVPSQPVPLDIKGFTEAFGFPPVNVGPKYQ